MSSIDTSDSTKFDLKEFEASFDGRDQKFLAFLTMDWNKDMYNIIKTKRSELQNS